MNFLLFFFAIPVSLIILSVIFETLIKCPFKIAGITFSVFLILAVALGGSSEWIVATIAYTIISYITAYLTCIVMNSNRERKCCNNRNIYQDDVLFQAPIVRNTYNENFEENSFTIPNNVNLNNSSNNLNTCNETSNNCPYRRYR